MTSEWDGTPWGGTPPSAVVPAPAAAAAPWDRLRTTDLTALVQALAGASMGPGVPGYPAHPEAQQPRMFDYAPGYNVTLRPRPYEEIGFPALRNLARGWDVAALCIQRNVDDLVQLRWEIRPKAVPGMDRDAVRARRARLEDVRAAVEGRLMTPDQRRAWPSWLRAYATELYETDAATMYLQMARDGSLYGIRSIDGTTIALILDERGEPPPPPMPAYRQVIQGTTWQMYMADADLPPEERRLSFDQSHMIYEPYWARNDSPYGHPPMEAVILTVQRALARQILDLSLYTEGTTPFDFWKVPADWTGIQIADLQKLWDDLQMRAKERAHMRFMPGGPDTGLEHGFIEPKTETEEFLLHVGCAAYGRSPMEMGFIRSSGGAGLGGKSVVSEQQKGSNKGVRGVAFHIKALLDRIINRHYSHELEIVFPELEETISEKERTEAEDTRIRNGSLGIDEARLARDLDPLAPAQPGASNVFFLGKSVLRALDVIGTPAADPEPGGANPPLPSAVPGRDAEAAGATDAPEDLAKADVADVVYRALAKQYPEELLGWVREADWRYEAEVPLAMIDHARRPGGRDDTNVRHITDGLRVGEPLHPIVLVDPGQPPYTIADGWHRTLAAEHDGRATVPAFVASGVGAEGPWDRAMHDAKMSKAAPDPAGDLRRWRRKAIRALRESGSAGVPFESSAIAEPVRTALAAALPFATTADQVTAFFEVLG